MQFLGSAVEPLEHLLGFSFGTLSTHHLYNFPKSLVNRMDNQLLLMWVSNQRQVPKAESLL